MKYIKIILIIMCFCHSSFGQKTKTRQVSAIQNAWVSQYIRFDNKNESIDTAYTIYGRDARYSQIVEIFVIKKGDLYEIYSLLKSIRKFLQEEDTGTSSDIVGLHVSVDITIGMKYISIWDPQQGASGYVDLTNIQLKKLQDGILSFCEKDNIKIIKTKE